ncbi:MAG: fibronectin type III domain-containing protein [Actinomycetes bacterium]
MRSLKSTAATATLVAAAAAAIVLGPVAGANAVVSGPTAPAGLTVTRTAGAEANLTISWKPVTGVDHYTVIVREGATERQYVVPAGQTTYAYSWVDACNRGAVRVSAVFANGGVATTGDTPIAALAPAGITAPTSSRVESGRGGNVTWAAPTTATIGGVDGYKVDIVQVSNNQVVQTRISPDASEPISGLDPSRVYAARVTPFNRFGRCATSSILMGNRIPTAPLGLAVQRPNSGSDNITVTWRAPFWAGYGPVTGYKLGYGTGRVEKWVSVSGTQISLNLDRKKSWIFQIKAISSDDIGLPGKAIRISREGADSNPQADPRIAITDRGAGLIQTTFDSPVGTSRTYPRIAIAITPAAGGTTFTDTQNISAGTATVLFSTVPCGYYTVTVTGSGTAAGSRVFATRAISRCGIGPSQQQRD